MNNEVSKELSIEPLVRRALFGATMVIITAFLQLLTTGLLIYLVLDNNKVSKDNQLHIDCIVALERPELPENCINTVAALEKGGYIALPDTNGERDSTSTQTTTP